MRRLRKEDASASSAVAFAHAHAPDTYRGRGRANRSACIRNGSKARYGKRRIARGLAFFKRALSFSSVLSVESSIARSESFGSKTRSLPTRVLTIHSHSPVHDHVCLSLLGVCKCALCDSKSQVPQARCVVARRKALMCLRARKAFCH